MNTYIGLLRGINVGGHKKIIMAEFRTLLEQNGFKNVRTYIQSGNIVFTHSESNIDTLTKQLEKIIQEHYSFEVPTLILTPNYLTSIFDANPFIADKSIDETKAIFTFLKSKPQHEKIEELKTISFPNENIIIGDKVIYFHSSLGYGNAKFTHTFIERKLKVQATSRNFRTTLKLIEMSKS
jgi:uncharacterized protein (DUF1697 family)